MLLVLFLPRFAVAQGNLVVNGGFDSGVSGWTTNVSSGYYDPLKGDPGGCFTLYGSISQTIPNLVSGSSYAISGSYDVEGGTLGGTPSFGISMNGVVLDQVAPQDYLWHNFTFNYVAGSSSALLGLTAGLNETSDVYRVDNLSIQVVPEPDMMCLMGVGVGVILWCFRAGWLKIGCNH